MYGYGMLRRGRGVAYLTEAREGVVIFGDDFRQRGH
jgi:hypothetical protein